MGKLQYQKGSYMAAIPPNVVKLLKLKKGDEIFFSVNKKGVAEIFKIEEEQK